MATTTNARTWAYPSASSGAVHTVTQGEPGVLACTCQGWRFKRPGQPRQCKHTKDVITREGLVVEVRGDYVFVTSAAPAPVAAPLTQAPDYTIVKVQAMATTMTAATATFEGMKASAMVAGKFGHLLDPSGKIVGARFDKAFANGAWVMDEKLDGHRCQIVKRGDVVTTTLRSIPSLPPQVVADIQRLPFDIHLDGELVVPGGISTDVPNLNLRDQLRFLAFDVIDVMDQPVMHLPLTERRAMLELAGQHFTGAVEVVAQIAPSWEAVRAIWKSGGEGAILKLKNSVYRPGYRGAEWLKVKRLKQLTVTVTGFEAGSLGPTAVVLFDLPNGKDGRCKNQDLVATAADPQSFIGRRLVIQCQQLTRNGSPRHPMFEGWEFDHLAGDAE